MLLPSYARLIFQSSVWSSTRDHGVHRQNPRWRIDSYHLWNPDPAEGLQRWTPPLQVKDQTSHKRQHCREPDKRAAVFIRTVNHVLFPRGMIVKSKQKKQKITAVWGGNRPTEQSVHCCIAWSDLCWKAPPEAWLSNLLRIFSERS